MDLADYAEQVLLDWMFIAAVTPTRPTSTTVHLHTGDPGEAGTANEVTVGAWSDYAPVTVNRDGTTSPFWARTGSVVSNDGQIDFGNATITGADVTVTHVSVRDHAANVLYKGALASNKTISNGDPVRFPTGDLDMDLD